MKIVFMGTPEFSVPALRALHGAGHEICAVYSQPPRPAGRGKRARASAVQLCAEHLGVPVHTPASLRGGEAQAEFAALGADIAVVVAYGLILPQAVLDMPRKGCLNIHASLLPRWRGAAPIHRAVLAGDAETGVCIMQMEAGLDTGPVLLRQATAIPASETTGQLHDRLSEMGAGLIVQALADLDNLTPREQSQSGVSYAEKIDKSEAKIDWSLPACEVDRLIRGLSPFPGAWSMMGAERVKFLGCELHSSSGQHGVAGEVLSGELWGDFCVACGEGVVRITRAQRPGKRAMATVDFLRGAPLPDRLGQR